MTAADSPAERWCRKRPKLAPVVQDVKHSTWRSGPVRDSGELFVVESPAVPGKVRQPADVTQAGSPIVLGNRGQADRRQARRCDSARPSQRMEGHQPAAVTITSRATEGWPGSSRTAGVSVHTCPEVVRVPARAEPESLCHACCLAEAAGNG